ncbi:MAG: hypothetical protein R3A12_03690 [Ignavibacteria bacterium]|nr:hypothetical protein [Ignavibacteriota bacterium]
MLHALKLKIASDILNKIIPDTPRLSENNSDIPASKARRLKEEHFEGFYLGVFEP